MFTTWERTEGDAADENTSQGLHRHSGARCSQHPDTHNLQATKPGCAHCPKSPRPSCSCPGPLLGLECPSSTPDPFFMSFNQQMHSFRWHFLCALIHNLYFSSRWQIKQWEKDVWICCADHTVFHGTRTNKTIRTLSYVLIGLIHYLFSLPSWKLLVQFLMALPLKNLLFWLDFIKSWWLTRDNWTPGLDCNLKIITQTTQQV